MNIDDIENFDIGDAVGIHRKLNPLLWRGDHLLPEVREQLLEIARDFVDFMGVDDLKVSDVRLYGSNASFNYTRHSDIDLHILIDMIDINNDDVYRELFNAKKTLYNTNHPITVRGYDVELYAQDKDETVKSAGEYSVLKNRWIKYPGKRAPTWELAEVRAKFKKLVAASQLALRDRNLDLVDALLDTIRKYRQAGLSSGGEFSPENLAYKALRSRGIVDKLYRHRDRLHTRDLSIDEDYDAEHPPGPEFKPTMPAGTVRVDVSDVYDWYKLGQHISNLDGLGKHDFGKGPPSTILSFGDEDLEHKYIKDLEKTGLKTTDIDPVDPLQPKGMKRQKTDPTYNVNESHDRKWNIPGTLYYWENHQLKGNWEPRHKKFSNHAEATAWWYKRFTGMPNRQGEYKFEPKLHNITGRTDLYPRFITDDGDDLPVYDFPLKESASGYIPSDAERNDPRFKTALTVDIGPDAIKDNASKLGLGKIHRSGRPPLARTNGATKKR